MFDKAQGICCRSIAEFISAFQIISHLKFDPHIDIQRIFCEESLISAAERCIATVFSKTYEKRFQSIWTTIFIWASLVSVFRGYCLSPLQWKISQPIEIVLRGRSYVGHPSSFLSNSVLLPPFRLPKSIATVDDLSRSSQMQITCSPQCLKTEPNSASILYSISVSISLDVSSPSTSAICRWTDNLCRGLCAKLRFCPHRLKKS